MQLYYGIGLLEANYLAKVDAITGDLDTTFVHPTGPFGPVNAFAVSGSSLYIGGRFTTYDGAPARHIAKVDATTGALETMFSQGGGPSDYVHALAVAGSSLYVGGSFRRYRGAPASRIAKVDRATGALDTTFTQATGADATVYSLAISGSSLFAGGDFTTYRGAPTRFLAKVDRATGELDAPFMRGSGPIGSVRALAVSGSSLHVGGAFTTYRGADAFYAMAVDPVTGALQ